MADGERETVTVEADNIQDARAKARAGAETGSTVGLPVLQAAPTRAARPIVQPGGGMGDTGFIRLPLPGDPQTAPMPVLESDFLGDTGFVRLPGIRSRVKYFCPTSCSSNSSRTSSSLQARAYWHVGSFAGRIWLSDSNPPQDTRR